MDKMVTFSRNCAPVLILMACGLARSMGVGELNDQGQPNIDRITSGIASIPNPKPPAKMKAGGRFA